jgi:PHD/YefM family antitoxin component YafN of YafNO toxin-antitoxin module
MGRFILSRRLETDLGGGYPRGMTRAITEEEFATSKADLLSSVGEQTFLIEKDGRPIAALISISEYESTREARVERAIQAMDALGEYMQSVATPEELDELEKALDRKAS